MDYKTFIDEDCIELRNSDYGSVVLAFRNADDASWTISTRLSGAYEEKNVPTKEEAHIVALEFIATYREEI